MLGTGAYAVYLPDAVYLFCTDILKAPKGSRTPYQQSDVCTAIKHLHSTASRIYEPTVIMCISCFLTTGMVYKTRRIRLKRVVIPKGSSEALSSTRPERRPSNETHRIGTAPILLLIFIYHRSHELSSAPYN